MLLLPVVSAATTLGSGRVDILYAPVLRGVSLPIFFIDRTRYQIGPDEQRELILRLIIFAATGFLTNMLAAATREQSRKFKKSPSSWPTPIEASARRKRLCGAPTGWRRSDSFPPDSRTSCAIRWAPSRRRPRC